MSGTRRAFLGYTALAGATVLAGAAETITRDRPVLLIEIEETHSGRAIEDSLAAVTAYGFQGLTLIGGMLCELYRFSPEDHHRAPARRQD